MRHVYRVSENRGTPSHHAFQIGILPHKPSILEQHHLWKPPCDLRGLSETGQCRVRIELLVPF